MSQYNFGTIDPYVVDGVQLAGMLNNWRDAIHTWHRGPSRPSYAVPGMMWVDDSGGATGWVVRVHMGAAGDTALFVYNTTTGAIGLIPASLQTNSLIAQGTAPYIAWYETDNPVDKKRWEMATVASTGALELRSITDGGSSQAVILINRDGTIIQPNTPRIYNEVVSTAGATSMQVTVPAGTKQIEIDYYAATAADQTLRLRVQVGGGTVGTATYSTQIMVGSGATTTSSGALAQTAWVIGTGNYFKGSVRPSSTGTTFGNCAFEGTGYAQAVGGARYAVVQSGDSTAAPSAVTGFQLSYVADSVFTTGCYMRAYIVT